MKRLENALKVAEHTNAMLAYWDKDLVCRFANSSYINWFGLSPVEMIDKITLPELLGPIYETNYPYIKAVLQGKSQVFERDIPLPSGEVKNTIATYTPDLVNGLVAGFYVHVADVSAIKKNAAINQSHPLLPLKSGTAVNSYLNDVEHLLRNSLYTKFPGLLELAKQHFISTTKLKKDFKDKYNVTIFSYYRSLQMQAASKYIKRKIYSMKQLAEMFGFDNPTNFSTCYKKYSSSTKFPNLRNTVDKVPGSGSDEVSAVNPGNAVAVNALASQQDQELAQKLERLEYCLEHLKIGTWERDFETSKTTWNNAAKQLLELPLDFEPDMTPALHFYKKGGPRELAKKHLQEALTTGKPFDFKADLVTAKGKEKTVRVSGFAVFEGTFCKKIYGTFIEIPRS